jgi:hypothetical protein
MNEFERKRTLLALQEQAINLPIGGELNITRPDDRRFEFTFMNWAYRAKYSNKPVFFRRETRGNEMYIIRDK